MDLTQEQLLNAKCCVTGCTEPGDFGKYWNNLHFAFCHKHLIAGALFDQEKKMKESLEKMEKSLFVALEKVCGVVTELSDDVDKVKLKIFGHPNPQLREGGYQGFLC